MADIDVDCIADSILATEEEIRKRKEFDGRENAKEERQRVLNKQRWAKQQAITVEKRTLRRDREEHVNFFKEDSL
jgi:spore cortex formation protein SpoVR/YcgB (stage V sporulation)